MRRGAAIETPTALGEVDVDDDVIIIIMGVLAKSAGVTVLSRRAPTSLTAGGDGCIASVGLMVKGAGEYDGEPYELLEECCEEAQGDRPPTLPSGDVNVTEDMAEE